VSANSTTSAKFRNCKEFRDCGQNLTFTCCSPAYTAQRADFKHSPTRSIVIVAANVGKEEGRYTLGLLLPINATRRT